MTNVNDFIGKYRNIITIALSLIGIVLMAYYDYCDTECSYLRGDLLGIDLKWVGIAYMAVIIIGETKASINSLTVQPQNSYSNSFFFSVLKRMGSPPKLTRTFMANPSLLFVYPFFAPQSCTSS